MKEPYTEIQVVELYIGNSDMSAHCPFCGHSSGPEGNCEHLLYIIVEGVFCDWSDRFVVAANLEDGNLYDGSPEEIRARGGPVEIASGISLQGHVQFVLETVNDLIRVGFADIPTQPEPERKLTDAELVRSLKVNAAGLHG